MPAKLDGRQNANTCDAHVIGHISWALPSVVWRDTQTLYEMNIGFEMPFKEIIINCQSIDPFLVVEKKKINELNTLHLFDDEGKHYQTWHLAGELDAERRRPWRPAGVD